MPAASLQHQQFVNPFHFSVDSSAFYHNRQHHSSSPSDYQDTSPHDDMIDGQFTSDDFHDHNVSHHQSIGFQNPGYFVERPVDSGDNTSPWPDTPDQPSSWDMSRPQLSPNGSSESESFVHYPGPYQGFPDIPPVNNHAQIGNRRLSSHSANYQTRDRQPQIIPGQAANTTPSDNSSTSTQPTESTRTSTGHARRPKVPHTQAERRYRENLNMHLETLRKTLPNVQPSPGKYGGGSVVTSPTGEEIKVGMSPGAGWKPSKAEVIASAIGYIRLLENENRVLWSEVNALR